MTHTSILSGALALGFATSSLGTVPSSWVAYGLAHYESPPPVSAAVSPPISQVHPLHLFNGPAGGTPQFQNFLEFLSPRLGFALSHQGAFVHLESTQDGGAHWHVIPTPANLSEADMLSARVGWIAVKAPGQSAPMIVERTDSGGSKWQTQAFPQIKEDGIDQMDFLTPNVGWIEVSRIHGSSPMTNPLLFHTTNGGKTWSRQALPSVRHGAWSELVSFVSPTTGWLLTASQPSTGFQPKWLYHTTNGGRTWKMLVSTKAHTFPTMGYADLMTFVDNRVGYLQLARGGLLRTTDGGIHWQLSKDVPFDPQTQAPPTALSFVSPLRGFTIMGSAIWRTENAGQSWTPVYPALAPDGPISFSSPRRGFAVGIYGNLSAVLQSRNGGRSWQLIDHPLRSWEAVLAKGATVYAISFDPWGKVIVSRDQGRIFTKLAWPSPSPYLARSLGLSASQRLFILSTGAYGASLGFTPTNHGGEWRSLVLPTGSQALAQSTPTVFWDLTMPDLAVHLDLTHNSGKTWKSFRLTPSQALGVPGGIFFLGHQFGYFWTSSSLFLTQNGGKSWRELTLSPSDGTIGGVDFISPQQGWLTTLEGVYHTTNQGRTWVLLQS